MSTEFAKFSWNQRLNNDLSELVGLSEQSQINQRYTQFYRDIDRCSEDGYCGVGDGIISEEEVLSCFNSLQEFEYQQAQLKNLVQFFISEKKSQKENLITINSRT